MLPQFFREACSALGAMPASGTFANWTPEASLEVMEANGIRAALTSVSYPAVHFMEPGQARSMARKCNDYAAELHQRWPERFGAFTLVPMHDMKHAIEEIEYSLDVLKHDGVCLFASYGEKFLGDAAFDPVLEALNARDAVVFVHPTFHPSSKDLSLPFPGFMIEYPFDTTRAAANLIFSGALERFPRIRFILSHAGGTLPFLAWRLSVSPQIGTSKLPKWSPEKVREGIRKFWFDTALSPGPEVMGALRQVADPGRIVFGSDWPYVSAAVVAEEVKSLCAPGLLSEAERQAIDRDNAAAILPRFARVR
jgi:predicted TIM-barrel fold metal-dependent hydrolase